MRKPRSLTGTSGGLSRFPSAADTGVASSPAGEATGSISVVISVNVSVTSPCSSSGARPSGFGG